MDINRKIAEKVMGWKFKTINDYTPFRHVVDDGGYILNGRVWKFLTGFNSFVWNPAERTDHAFEVVEKMLELGWTFAICNNNPGCGGDYSAEFWNNDHPMSAGEFMIFDDNPATAISLAALEAIK